MKKVGGRLIVLALVVVLSVIFFIPSYQPFYQALPAWLKTVMPNKGITLGLDLQGGIHLVMEVDEDRAVEIAVDRSVVSLQDLLVDKKGNCGNWRLSALRIPRSIRPWRRSGTASTSSAWPNRWCSGKG
ncbi:MAG: hypothetical protein NTX84_11740 [Nitrospirae bacterium]|nr:hypothetical protein [Nitrospirota bacterium]